MKEFRQLGLISLFIVLCSVAIIYSHVGKWDRLDLSKKAGQKQEEGQESYFKGVNYFVTGDKPQLQLDASELSINDKVKQTVFLKPKGVALSRSQKPIYYEGDRGFLNQINNILAFQSNVKVQMDDSISTADRMEYFIDNNKVDYWGNVHSKSRSRITGDKFDITSDEGESWLEEERSTYRGHVKGKIERQRAYEENLDFRSQRLDLNLKTSFAELNEDVYIKKQLLTARSHRGEIFLENYNKKLKYFVLYDDVKVEEKVWFDGPKGRENYVRKAFSEKLEGIMSENKIVLTGYPKVYQQNDVIKGNRIILRENNEVVEVDDANTNFILKD